MSAFTMRHPSAIQRPVCACTPTGGVHATGGAVADAAAASGCPHAGQTCASELIWEPHLVQNMYSGNFPFPFQVNASIYQLCLCIDNSGALDSCRSATIESILVVRRASRKLATAATEIVVKIAAMIATGSAALTPNRFTGLPSWRERGLRGLLKNTRFDCDGPTLHP